MRPKERIMYIESKGNDGIFGSARIGRVRFSKSGKSIHYAGHTFETLSGKGFKSNYFDVASGNHYWISGCHNNGNDALYNTDVTVDKDVLEEYWCEIRNMPENKSVNKFRAKGKY